MDIGTYREVLPKIGKLVTNPPTVRIAPRIKAGVITETINHIICQLMILAILPIRNELGIKLLITAPAKNIADILRIKKTVDISRLKPSLRAIILNSPNKSLPKNTLVRRSPINNKL